MSRYIDAVALKERLIQNITLTNAIDRSFSEAPSIDIVRCKECKNSIASVDNSLCCRCWYDRLGFWEEVKADDFCSYGEREGE